jgi:hypothetical protein
MLMASDLDEVAARIERCEDFLATELSAPSVVRRLKDAVRGERAVVAPSRPG